MLLEAKQRRKSFISITPLIDVVFILLLFFMLSSTFLKMKQIEIKTPLLGQSQTINDNSEIHKFLLVNENLIYINANKYFIDSVEFEKILQTYITSDNKINLAITKDVKVQSLISLIDYMSSKGISNINLAKSEDKNVD